MTKNSFDALLATVQSHIRYYERRYLEEEEKLSADESDTFQFSLVAYVEGCLEMAKRVEEEMLLLRLTQEN